MRPAQGNNREDQREEAFELRCHFRIAQFPSSGTPGEGEEARRALVSKMILREKRRHS